MKLRPLTVCLLAAAALAALPQNTTRRLGRDARRQQPSLGGGDGNRHADTLYSDIPARITGYEKPLRATKETMMVNNADTARTLTEISLQIDYLTPQGAMLHSRTVTLYPLVPPQGTRMIQLRSWDPNRLFYYHINRPNTSAQATPYTVRITPVTAVYQQLDQTSAIPGRRADN